MKKRTKLKLKKWVKETLALILFASVIYFAADKAVDRYVETINECSDYYGYVCSSYTAQQYAKGIRH